jgi:peptidoglycan/xylan/chitin deacetylase (PgdA/CDA1 family)
MNKDFLKKVRNKLHYYSIQSGFDAFRNTSGARIIMYHGIDLIENKSFNGRFIGIKNFEAQIRYFKKHFNVISLSDYASGNYKKDRFTIAITFDDGYRNNFKYAFPILEKYQVPASFYITGLNAAGENIVWADFVDIATSFISRDVEINNVLYEKVDGRLYNIDSGQSLYDVVRSDSRGGYHLKQRIMQDLLAVIKDFRNTPELKDYWELMTDDEIRLMSASKYVEIGSHGFYHNDLAPLSHETAMDEIKLSKKYLENIIQKDLYSIAYPTGSYTRLMVEDVALLGIPVQLAVNYLHKEDEEDQRIFNRFGVYPFYSARMLGHILAHQKK